jgi:phenylacetate-CoA ligase
MKIRKSPSAIQQTQFKRIQSLVELAYNESSFYRSIYDRSGFHPSQLQKIDDMKRIPIINRKMIQDAQDADVQALVPESKRAGISWKQTTSGSSGLPITIFASRSERLRILGIILRDYRLNGLKFFETSVTIKDPIDIAKPNIVQRLGGYRHDYYDIYQPVEEIYKSIVTKWKEIAVLKSMPSDLANLAWYIDANNLPFPKVRSLFTDSEKLDDPTRLFIERVFGTKAIDYYATTEAGIIAFQSEKSGNKYHINDDSVFVETVSNPALDSTDSDLVITGLINFTTPIIRYQIGDVVTAGDRKPVADIPFSTIERIHGKYLDFLVRPDGKIVSSHAAKQNLTHLEGIRRFQVVQTDVSSLTIFIAPDRQWSDVVKDEILKLFTRDFGPEMNIEITIDKNLVHKSSDYKKFKVVESKVAQELLSRN